MANEKEKPEPTTAPLAAESAPPTFTIVQGLLAGDVAYKPGDEAKLLADKDKVGPKAIAGWVRSGAIVGQFPGVNVDADQGDTQSATARR